MLERLIDWIICIRWIDCLHLRKILLNFGLHCLLQATRTAVPDCLLLQELQEFAEFVLILQDMAEKVLSSVK